MQPLPPPPRSDFRSLEALLHAVDRRGRTFLFMRKGLDLFSALAPCVALLVLLLALFGPLLLERSEPIGMTVALGALGVAGAAAAAGALVLSRRPPRGTWVRPADDALELEGRLDAASCVLARESATRLAPLVLNDANTRAASLTARDAVKCPALARKVAIGLVAAIAALLATRVPPVRAAAPDGVAARGSGSRAEAPQSSSGEPPAGRSGAESKPEPPKSQPPEPKPEPEKHEPKTEPPKEPPPPQPKPEPQPAGGAPPPTPLGPPPETPEGVTDPKFLEPLVGEGPRREKDAFTPEPDEGTRPARPLSPETLNRIFPEIRRRVEAALPRQAFSDEEKRIVKRYFETLIPQGPRREH